MKSDKKHTLSLYRYLALLSGIVLFSILPLDLHSGDNGFSHLVQYETDYYSVNTNNTPTDEDSDHSNQFLDPVFKEITEKKDSTEGMNGLAVFKQGIAAKELGFTKLTLDKTYFFKRTKYLSIDYSLDLLNKANNNFSSPFQPFANSIAINAP